MSIPETCGLLKKELLDNGYEYGFCLHGKTYKPDVSKGFDREFIDLLSSVYRVQAPNETKKAKVATCNDAVVLMKSILDEHNIPSRIWLLHNSRQGKFHTVLTFEEEGKTVYLELTPQSGKPWYGKELIFDSKTCFTAHYTRDDCHVIDVTDAVVVGQAPDFILSRMNSVFTPFPCQSPRKAVVLRDIPPEISLRPMTAQMYHTYFQDYQNDPDLYIDKSKYTDYVYNREAVNRYIQRQIDKGRICFAVLWSEEMVGELVLKNIEPRKCATMGIAMRKASYKDRGFGTRAEQLAVEYVFGELDIPVLYADCLLSNHRSQHVLEKVGFQLIRQDGDFKYYRIQRS